MPPPSRRSKRLRRVRKSRLGLLTTIVLIILLGLYLMVLESSRPHVSGDRLRYDRFTSLVEQRRVLDATFLDEDAYVTGRYLADNDRTLNYNSPLLRGTQAEVLEILRKQRIPITINQQVGKRIAAVASFTLPGLMLVVLFAYLVMSYKRGTGLFGVRSGARRITAEDTKVTFADVAGQDAAVTELREITTFLSDPQRFADLGVQVPKGILLYGPPGCGKTLLARALAGEAHAAFFSISGSDFVEVYVGVGAARVRDLFAQARENAPAVIFIDELDSIGRARGVVGTVQSHGEQEQSLNQVLAELDGFSPTEGIIVVAATNRPDVLDQALLRPGRFDRTVGLERPDEAARLAILEVHARGKRLAEDVDLATVASHAIGLTGADLASVLNEGGLLAARAGAAEISSAHLEAALQRIMEAPERQRRLSLRERSIGRRYASEQRATFADVAGADEAIAELAEVREYLTTPDRFADIGARVPRGILLAGPPGCGKTLLARAVAGEANAAFLSVAGSEFVEVFAGEGASRVRELFAEARSVAPAIVFIDEIDAIGARRGAAVDGHREREQTLNQILVELDGFEARTGVIIMAATNRPDILDPALVRPGRFDRQVEVGLPDRGGRQAILALHARGKRLASDVDLGVVAGVTQGFSGADLANVLNEAALLAGRRGLEEVTMALVDEGTDRAMLGVASKVTVMSAEERRMIAYHESGHAVVALGLRSSLTPHRLTLLARPGTLGHCLLVDSHDRVLQSRSDLLDGMAYSLGGRAAEELVFGEPASGAKTDLQQANHLARYMVCELGMSAALGPLAFDNGMSGRPLTLCDDDGRAISAEVRRLIEESYQRALEVLTESRALLDRVAEALLERESLTAADLKELAQPGD